MYSWWLQERTLFRLSDHALVGHAIQTTDVVDEFECQLKCMGNNGCKSINVHRGDSNGNRSCELNNKTRQMKPGHFKKKKGSSYYSSVQVGFGLSRFVDNFPFFFSLPRTIFRNYCYILMKTETINCYWLISRHSLRKQNTALLKISGKRFSKRVLTIFIF